MLALAAVAVFIAGGCDSSSSRRRAGSGPGPGPGPGVSTGIVVDVASVRVDAGRRIAVEFSLRDEQGGSLSLADLDGPPRFVFAYVDRVVATGYTRYRSYNVASVEGRPFDPGGGEVPPALARADQVTSDAGGRWLEVDAGEFVYTSGVVLPADFDRAATHTAAGWVSRDGRSSVANIVRHFVPNGDAPAELRDVVLGQSCETCHDDINAHGGTRREIGLCIVCHTDQTTDPETGENLEFGRLVHKIHRGAELVDPFVVVGYGQRVHDYSGLLYPQDLRNCETCHDEVLNPAMAASAWRLQPARSTCGSCHDAVDFDTGEGHADGIAQPDDVFCTTCHRSEEVVELDRSVPGSHAVPEGGAYDPLLTLAITEVAGFTPGGQPSIRFTVADRDGPVALERLDRIAVTFAGPTADYAQLLAPNRLTILGRGAVPSLVENGAGDYSFTPDVYRVPSDATGTWAIGLESRTDRFTVGPRTFRFGGNNPVVAVDVTSGVLGGGAPVSRRQIVDADRCESCHETLRFHGDLRVEVEYCVACHNRWATDEARRPGLDAVTNPPESIDFSVMIHKIHRGADLANGYTVYGFGGTPHDFTKVEYPRRVDDCAACHLEGTEALTARPDAAATVRNIAGVPVPGERAVLTPSMASCLSCHDDDGAWTHARSLSIVNGPDDWTEGCESCHGPGRAADPARFHGTSR